VRLLHLEANRNGGRPIKRAPARRDDWWDEGETHFINQRELGKRADRNLVKKVVSDGSRLVA